MSSRGTNLKFGAAALFAVAAAVVIAALLFGGCGGSDSRRTSFDQGQGAPGSFAPGAGPGGANPAQLQRFTSCLKKQGVDMPEPGSGPPSGGPPSGGGQPLNSPKARKALQACRQYLPQGGPPSGAGPPGTFSTPTS